GWTGRTASCWPASSQTGTRAGPPAPEPTGHRRAAAWLASAFRRNPACAGRKALAYFRVFNLAQTRFLVTAMNLIQQFEAEQMSRRLPDFLPGDTVVVNVKVKEGNRERIQAYEGVVIAKRNRGLNSAFTVRKISHGTGVEGEFQRYSPANESDEIKRRGKVRGAKLYYLRGLEGKAARIREDLAAAARDAAERDAARKESRKAKARDA